MHSVAVLPRLPLVSESGPAGIFKDEDSTVGGETPDATILRGDH